MNECEAHDEAGEASRAQLLGEEFAFDFKSNWKSLEGVSLEWLSLPPAPFLC